MCKHEIGDVGDPCLVCGGVTVYFNKEYSFCKNINCQMWYMPQQWFEKIVDKDGNTAIKLRRTNGTHQDC